MTEIIGESFVIMCQIVLKHENTKASHQTLRGGKNQITFCRQDNSSDYISDAWHIYCKCKTGKGCGRRENILNFKGAQKALPSQAGYSCTVTHNVSLGWLLGLGQVDPRLNGQIQQGFL